MKYEQLVEYKRKKGNCLVPHKYEQDRSLGWWVNKQRNNHKSNKIRLDRKELLNQIGFTWKPDNGDFKPDDKLWHEQYAKLLEYKRKKGHCRVPQRNKDDTSLGRWVTNQRARHAKMLPDRKELLDALEFVWKPDAANQFKPDDKLWHQQYAKLLEYKRINGNCRVPQSYRQDTSLGRWVMTQRARHAKMLPDRKELLDALEFVWKADAVATRFSTTNVRGLAI
jgi:hypothetical protein